MSSNLQVFVTKTKDYLKQESDRLDLLLKKLQEAKAPDVDECLYESDGWRGTVNSKWVVDSMAAKHGWTKLRELNAPNPPAYIPPADMDAAAEAASADAASIRG